MTVRDALTEASNRIGRRDAETLLAHLLSRDRAWIFAYPEVELTAEQIEAFLALAARRAAHEPLQYLTGQKEFFGLRLRVTRDTLIPRPETELLVEAVLAWITEQRAEQPAEQRAGHPAVQPLRILDIGTGSGAIALALAAELADRKVSAEITATDISPAALAIARENAQRLNLGDRVRFLLSDLFTVRELHDAAPFDVIVSNPPYVALSDAPTLQPEVLHHEPHSALFAGATGLDIYRRLIPRAHAHLRREGLLALEFGFGQRDDLRALFEIPSTNEPAAPGLWRSLRFVDDYAGIPRIGLATRA